MRQSRWPYPGKGLGSEIVGPAREVAQVASVIGRDFSYGLLRMILAMEVATLQAALERLAEADILLVEGLPPNSDYRFKHALIQEAAYENLLKSRRQVLHRRVGEVLRDHFADSATAEPELLAHHFAQAGLTEAANRMVGQSGTTVVGVRFQSLPGRSVHVLEMRTSGWKRERQSCIVVHGEQGVGVDQPCGGSRRAS
jgi:hypothetical protein